MARGSSVAPDGRHGALERLAEHALARAADEALDRFVPERDAAVAVEHRHALLEELDHFAPLALFLEPLDVVGVDPVAERQRRGDDRQHGPHPLIDEHRDRGRERWRPSHTTASRASAVFAQVRLTGCLVSSGMASSTSALCTR